MAHTKPDGRIIWKRPLGDSSAYKKTYLKRANWKKPWYVQKMHMSLLMEQCREKRIADNTLVALTLMIAESRTAEKDVMVKVVVNLINKDNQ